VGCLVKRLAVTFPMPGAVAVHEEPLPPPGPGQILVETRLSAISSGTEMLVYRGQVPTGMAVDETISALEGAFSYPIKYGYAAVGRVIDCGPGVNAEWLERDVFAFNPHETHFIADTSALHVVPPDIGPDAAAFLPNMETAVSLVMDGRPVIGEQVAVVGQGIVGLLVARLLAEMPLSALVTLDRYPARRRWSRELGATAALDPAETDAIDEARRVLRGRRDFAGADLVYECSGNPAALDTAIALAGYNGRIVVGSWYGSKQAPVNLGGRFHRDHLRIISSQVSHLAPEWSGRWTKARRLGVAWEMLRLHRPERLISHRFPITQAAEAYRLLDERPGEALQVVFVYG
jgi:2-desacetyl-2-hydroxyethyl bacteriochlorophyllide A dehydrogenase